MNTKRWFLLPLVVLVLGPMAAAAEPAEPGPVQAEKFRPRWNVGDRWTVQTTTRQFQASGKQKPVQVQWQFTVEAKQKLAGRPCLRIVVRPSDAAEPKTQFWVDQKTGSIRQIQTQIPTRDGYQTVTESYVDQTGSAAPVVGPMTALPIDIPQFPEPGLKSLGTYSYTIVSGSGGVKAIGDVGFTTEIRQRFSKPSAESIKSIGGDDEHIKSLKNRALVEVKLSTSDYSTRQIWSQGEPWPTFSDNGVTQSRLLKVTRAKDAKRQAAPPRPDRRPKTTQRPPQDDDAVKNLETGAGLERGTAKYKPWSGYWWPIREGRLLVPLGKYDRLTDHKAAVWEKKHNPPGRRVPKWFGYCHAWAAASILEKEPRGPRLFRLASNQLSLDVGDQKGLLTACHTQDLANSWGDRFGDGQGSEDRSDLRPDLLWRLLKLHLGQRGVPLVLDVEAGVEVWNYPVYEYELRYRPTSDGKYLGSLTLLMADDAVSPGYRGTKPYKQTYQFTFKMRGGNVVSGSGQWVGRSKQNHPDFAWYPFKAVAVNPEVKYKKVRQLVSTQTPASSPQPVNPPVNPLATPPTRPVTPPATPSTQPDARRPAPIVVSPIELVALIANKTSSFKFDATIDRFDGASYKPGETFPMRVTSEKPGYLYLLQVDSSGTPSLLYPAAGEDNRIRGGKLVEVKPGGIAGGFPVVGPAGILRIKSIVTSRPVAFSGSFDALQQGQGKRKVRPVQFRWHPTQQRQIKALLSQKQQSSAKQLGCKQPQDVLGPFAQDMTMLYVDSR